jgi:hypothetical protein
MSGVFPIEPPVEKILEANPKDVKLSDAFNRISVVIQTAQNSGALELAEGHAAFGDLHHIKDYIDELIMIKKKIKEIENQRDELNKELSELLI